MEPRETSTLRRAGDGATALAFLAFAFLPLCVWAARGEVEIDVEREFRRPAPAPTRPTTLRELSAWPRRVDAWYADRFGLRSTLIRWHNVAKLSLFRVSPTSEIVLGKDDWLFTTRANSVAVHRGAMPFPERELALWQRVLEDRRDWLAERGIAYVFAIAPNKETIYPELMPDRYAPFGPDRREQLLEWMAERSDFEILDLTGPLLEAKRVRASEGFVYFPLGTHWNDRGALHAYEALLERVVRETGLASLAPRPPAAFELRPTDFQDDSWAGRLYMEDLLRQENAALVHDPKYTTTSKLDDIHAVYERPGTDLPRLVMFHDSFGEKLRPLLADHFSRSTFLWVNDFETQVLEDERPDVVVQLQVERALGAYRPHSSPMDSAEVLSAEFARSRRVLLDVPPATLAPVGAMEVTPGPVPGSALLRSGGGAVALPEFEPPDDAWPVFRIELEAPAPTLFILEFLTETEREYSRRARAVRRPISAGRQVVWARLLVPDLHGPLRLRPGNTAGDYVLHGVEVRAVE